MPEIRIVEGAQAPMAVLRDHRGDTPLPALWLRARSPDPSERDGITGQRLVNPHLLPDDIELTGARHAGDMLELSFSDGFSCLYDPQDLIDGAELHEGCPPARPWQSDLAPQPVYRWPELARDQVLYRAVKDLIELGFVLIHDTPTQADSIIGIARRFAATASAT